MKCISELGVGKTEENRKHLSVVSHHPLAKCDPTGINSPVFQDKHNEFTAMISEKPQGRKRRLYRAGLRPGLISRYLQKTEETEARGKWPRLSQRDAGKVLSTRPLVLSLLSWALKDKITTLNADLK